MKKLFIIGCPRSGTTWTGLLLARHPSIVACMETSVMQTVASFTKWSRIGDKAEDARYIHSIVTYDERESTTTPPVGGAPHFVAMHQPDELRAFCISVAEQAYAPAFVHKPSATLLIDKTPQNLLYGEFIAKLFPDAYFLHVVRDPRSVVLSIRNGADDFIPSWPRDATEGARYWLKDFERARKVAGFSQNYREVRYEAMLENPVRELGALLEWLGISADNAWLKAATDASSMLEMKKGVPGTPKNFFRKGSATGWKDEMSSEDVAAIETALKEQMTELGYPFRERASERT